MNQLTEFLVNSILEEDKKEIIGIYGGGFKPPIKGHLDVLQGALDQYPEMDNVIVSVGTGVRDGIEQAESLLVWDVYQKYLPMKVDIDASKSGMPIKDIYKLAKENPDKTIYWIIGAREGREDDLQDIAARTKSIDKYGNIEVKVIKTADPNVSGTNARKALLANDKEKFFTFLPDMISDDERETIFTILRPASLNEDLSFEKKKELIKKIIKIAQSSGEHMSDDRLADLIARKIKIDTNSKPSPGSFKVIGGKPFTEQLNEHSMGDSIDLLPYLAKLTQHMIDKGYNIEPLPGLELIDDDLENAEDFFGNTAYYDPVGQIIVLYTHGRHPKDIARSYAHEMIHHIQNLENRLGNITTTNTQEDDHLNDLEAEANLKGTMTFRNWTDSLNEVGDASQKPYIWNRKVSKDEDVVEAVDYRFTTDLDTNYVAFFQMVGDGEFEFGFNIPGGNQAQVSNKGELFRVMATMVAIMKDFMGLLGNNWESISFSGSKDPSRGEDNRRDKLYMAYIQKHLPSTVKVGTDGDDMTVLTNTLAEGFNKKLGKDPFGLNAFAYELARLDEEGLLNEGRYDKFVNEISRIVFEMFKDIHDRGDKKGEFEFSVGPDDEDIYSEDFEFDLAGVVEITDDLYKVDGGANAGFDDKGDEITPLLSVKFKIPKNPDWQKVSFDIKDVVRHELEHLTQDGLNVKGVVVDPKDSRLDRPGKQMDDDQFIRDMIDADMLPKADYFKLKKEIDAMMQGLYYKAKKSRRPFKDVIDDYLATQPISQEEKETILNLWRSRNKALNLPVFENEEKVMDYKIFLDMDGVLADFDQRFEDLAGMPPREFEDKYGKNEFWDFIDEKHKLKFWIGIPVMDGAKKLVDFASKYDYELLTAPSSKKQSRLGKILWVKNHKDLFNTTPFINFKKAKEKHEIKPSLSKSDILVDDRADTIQRWNSAGGTGILYKSANQVINDLKKLGL